MINFQKGTIIVLLFGLYLFTGCSDVLPYSAYIDYVQDPQNGLVKESNINTITYKLQYWPQDIFVYQEYLNHKTDDPDIDSIKSRYDHFVYFKLSISYGGSDIFKVLNTYQKQELVKTILSLNFHRVKLKSGSGCEFPLVDCRLNRYFEFSKPSEIMFVFQKSALLENSNHIKFNMDDIGLGSGELCFEFNTRQIEKIPLLKIDKLKT